MITLFAILVTLPIAIDAWLAYREWDGRRFPGDRRAVRVVDDIGETF